MKISENPVEECFFGTVTVGERGQIVIPADARKKLNISSGDKLLVVMHPPTNGVLLCRMDGFREYLTRFIEGLDKLEEKSE